MVTKFKVYWNNGTLGGMFPHVFDTEEEAVAFGNTWTFEANIREYNDPDYDGYTFGVISFEEQRS